MGGNRGYSRRSGKSEAPFLPDAGPEKVSGPKQYQPSPAKLFGVTQPRISDLIRGKIGLFSLDALVKMAAVD
jgi:hypothetical protein